jgi:prophage tail gpP-like protein
MTIDTLTLTVNGKIYQGWTEAAITRSLDRCASAFELSVTERWAGQGQDWKIVPGDEAVVAISGTPILTGYVERYMPAYSKDRHDVRISGRSKTCDLVDCMPDIPGGQYCGYTVDRIARALAAPFSISVKVADGLDTGEAFPSAMIEKSETAYEFLDKLCRMREILACDEADGSLLFTQAGSGRAQGALVEGENILSASAEITSDRRFQTYAVLSQTPISYDNEAAQPHVVATATDSGVVRPRRFAEIAEIPADAGGAKARAEWRKLYNYGQSISAAITVLGWRQRPGGNLWDVNLLVSVKSAALALYTDLLIGAVTYRISKDYGAVTELELKPQAAYTPEPVKQKKKKGTTSNWNDVN